MCSRTVKATKDDSTGEEDNAKWILNIQWQMTGVDVHVDTGDDVDGDGDDGDDDDCFGDDDEDDDIVVSRDW